MYPDYIQKAADMFGGDPGLLNNDLVEELKDLAYLNNGHLQSTQVIALKIQMWMKENPDQRAYGD